MYFYLYQITNLYNDRVYVGVHKTKNLDDGYMGSGKILNQAYQKYGTDWFRKDILQFFELESEMFEAEKDLVTEEFIARDWTYNIKLGGEGGFNYINSSSIVKFKGKTHTDQTKRLISRKNTGLKRSDAAKLKISDANKRTNESRGSKVSKALKGRPKTDEQKKKIAESVRRRHQEKRGIGSLVDPLPSKQM